MLDFSSCSTLSNPFGFSSAFSNLDAIAHTLRHCGKIRAISRGKSLHSQIIKHGLYSIVFIANNLMGMYCDFKLYSDAQKLFDEMPERNVVSWTTSISAHMHAGNPYKALKVFTQMLDFAYEEPNRYTYSIVLKSCALVGDLEMGKWIHDRVSRNTQLRFDTVLVNAVLDMYVKCGSLEEARKVLDGDCPLNSTSWNTMISGYMKYGDLIEAENLFIQVSEPDAVSFNTMIAGFAKREDSMALDYVYMMHKGGIKLDNYTFPSALKMCGFLKSERMGEQIHAYIIKPGFMYSSFIGPSLIDMYSNCGRMNEATRLCDEYSTCVGSVSDQLALLNSMASGLVLNGRDKSSLNLVSKIHNSGLVLDAFMLSSALKACINLHNIRLGLQVHGFIITNGYQLDQIVGSILINLYAISGKLEDSLTLFRSLPHKDKISWTVLITNCVQKESIQLAFSLFRQMIYRKIEADHFVISSILKACASLPWLRGGEQVHSFCIRGGFESDNFILASLIDLYSKCGNIDDGLKVFESVTQKDTVCWTGIIVGCGYNGRAKEAIELLQTMTNSGEEPNNITFLGVLSACRHAGLVKEACDMFNRMRENHGLVPSLEHYCVMVDILSRDGRFEEAKKLLSDMPYEPGKNMWNAMLGASMTHQNADLGKLIILPFDSSGYATMANIYARLGMWEHATKLRELMRRVSHKESGKSWIEVGNYNKYG
ncbi:uncharacterized protein A4U43_C10F18110 [Asparagus officinalis]|uniref:Pentacotripeptide-repeat region of PRORP domain-containing protein n=1 Tax=Asparagus officinalis TaxID=4686 RepID=A0A5P1E6Y5_ASPOF|nr:pentatricopeptide repeat-containing protein At4g08210 [Asparagus officinalis]ONK57247.1 uncharacterized protein A4U43_C10F18110 [Asparagus officinalis]